MAWCPCRAELPGRKWQCVQWVPCLLPEPEPVPPAPTSHWDRESPGHSLPQGHPPIGVSPHRAVPPGPARLPGEQPGCWATCHPVPGALASHAQVSPGAQSGQVRCQSLPSFSLRCGANDPCVIPNYFSAKPTLCSPPGAGSALPPVLPSIIPGLRHGEPCWKVSFWLAPAGATRLEESPAAQRRAPGPCHLWRVPAGAPCTAPAGGTKSSPFQVYYTG